MPATPGLLGSAPRVVGVAALAVVTAGAVSAGAHVPRPEVNGGAAALAAAVAATDQQAVAPAEMELERPVRVRVSRDGVRTAAPSVRVGSQAGDAMASVKKRIAAERAAAAKRAAEKRAAEKRAAEKRSAEAKRWRLPLGKGSFRLSAEFGACSALWSSCHTGLDFAAPSGTPVGAVAAGTVVEASYVGAFGNRVTVRLPDGTEMWYAHLSAFTVSPGQRVKSGQKVGTVGSTGNSTGPHLHLEVHKKGSGPVDPFSALRAQGVGF